MDDKHRKKTLYGLIISINQGYSILSWVQARGETLTVTPLHVAVFQIVYTIIQSSNKEIEDQRK